VCLCERGALQERTAVRPSHAYEPGRIQLGGPTRARRRGAASFHLGLGSAVRSGQIGSRGSGRSTASGYKVVKTPTCRRAGGVPPTGRIADTYPRSHNLDVWPERRATVPAQMPPTTTPASDSAPSEPPTPPPPPPHPAINRQIDAALHHKSMSRSACSALNPRPLAAAARRVSSCHARWQWKPQRGTGRCRSAARCSVVVKKLRATASRVAHAEGNSVDARRSDRFARGHEQSRGIVERRKHARDTKC